VNHGGGELRLLALRSDCAVRVNEKRRSSELSQEWLSYLHAFVVGAAATFGYNPVDDLVGIGDIARLAVNAIREIDF